VLTVKQLAYFIVLYGLPSSPQMRIWPFDSHVRIKPQNGTTFCFCNVHVIASLFHTQYIGVFMPPIKCQVGCYVMAYASGVRQHLFSVNYRSNALIDWSDFYVAYWGVTRGRFLSMISSVAHPRWPPRMHRQTRT
jgi:hypothetical protein